MTQLTIGPHLSIAKGFAEMGRHAVAIEANTLAFFTRNPRGGGAKAIDPADVGAFCEMAKAHGFGPIVGHAAYTLNGAAKSDALRDFARETMADDLRRMAAIPGNYYNFHPGSHVGQGTDVGIDHIVSLLNAVLTPDLQTTVLLETMSGKGSEIGGSFEELARILQGTALQDSMGVCLDTCHVWDAGYDITGALDAVLEQFDKIIGLRRLKAIHLNDSMNPRGSRKDRHAKIGEGMIGLDAFARIINHPALRDLPFVLETPNDEPGWGEEIRMLRDRYRP